VIDSFKPQTLRAYYQKWYRPDNQAIIVVGDVDVNHMEDKIKELFAGTTLGALGSTLMPAKSSLILSSIWFTSTSPTTMIA
ncbi:MAG: insulinase family protein, partial [Prevotella sp.]|nr:insulinase family protein [Prevotella sp.]